MPAWFFAQLSLNEEHACSTVNLISLTISENRKTVNVRGLILVGDIHHKLNYQWKLIFGPILVSNLNLSVKFNWNFSMGRFV